MRVLRERGRGVGGGLKCGDRGRTSRGDDWVWYSSGNIARFFRAGVGVLVFVNTAGNVGIGASSPTSKLQVVGLPVFANNAAAIAGGLTAGAFYRTGADPDPVCVVH